MPSRINRAIELLEQDQPIYYTGGHTGAVLTYEQGKKDAHIWADYINIGMEHGCFLRCWPIPCLGSAEPKHGVSCSSSWRTIAKRWTMQARLF